MKMTNKGKMLLYRLYAFLIYLVPMTILFIVNIDEYDKDSSIVGFWGFIVILFIILAFKEYFLTLLKKRCLLMVSLVTFVIAMLMYLMAEKIILISAVSMVGAILSTFVSVVADVYERYAYKVVDGVKVTTKALAISDKQAWKEAYGLDMFVSGDEDNE